MADLQVLYWDLTLGTCIWKSAWRLFKKESCLEIVFSFVFLFFFLTDLPFIQVLFCFSSFAKNVFVSFKGEKKFILKLCSISSIFTISHKFKPQRNLSLQKKKWRKPFYTYLYKNLINKSRSPFPYFFNQPFDTVFLSFHNHLHIA